jgi:hypothetical protein
MILADPQFVYPILGSPRSQQQKQEENCRLTVFVAKYLTNFKIILILTKTEPVDKEIYYSCQ